MKQTKYSEKGSILLIFIIVLPFMMLIAMYYSQLSLASFRIARQDQLRTAAQLSADAGADFAIGKIALDNTWLGTGGEVTLQNETKTRTTYDVVVTNQPDNWKTLTVTGRSFSPGSSTTAAKTVRVAVDLRPVSEGNFSIIAGQGGLEMSNSSKVVGGDVFINGEIEMENSAQIGLSTKPVNVKVAHQICPNPPDATFPKVCTATENGQPIMIENQALIYGEVTATNQTDGARMFSPGLVAGSVTPKPLPTYDRAAQKAAVTTTLTGPISCAGSDNLIWAPNTKIVGNVTISGKCTVTVQGNVWITGSLETKNTAIMKVADTAGTAAPNIMVDGASGVNMANGTTMESNASLTGFRVYTFWSNSACSPDCTTLTGTDLFNSRDISTIQLQNSASGPNTVFYAYWSKVAISNSGQIGALIGQTVLMTNSATLTFGASAQVGGPLTYVVQGYRRS